MQRLCAGTECKLVSFGTCHCCQYDWCRIHFNEHIDAIKSRLNPLVDEINQYEHQLKAFNPEKMIFKSREKLDQWYDECKKIIEELYKQKLNELEQCMNEKMEKKMDEIAAMRLKATELSREGDVPAQDMDLLTIAVRTFKQDLNEFEHTCIEVKTQPLAIHGNCLRIEETTIDRLDFINLPVPYRTIQYSQQKTFPLACNDKFLLIQQKGNLCLVNQEMIIIKQQPWTHGLIMDICWSSKLDRFFVITKNNVYVIDESTMLFECVLTIHKQNLYSCTCSDTSLFLSTSELGSSIEEFSIVSPIQFVTQWHSPDTCSRDERIIDILHKNGKLILIILNQTTRIVRMELRSLATFEQLWTLPFDGHYKHYTCSCYSLNNDEWLVVDGNSSRLIHITKDGQVKADCAYNPRPYYASFFGPHLLVVSTDKNLTFHKM